MICETERLIIRKLIPEDFAAIHAMMRKPEVMYAWEHGFTERDTEAWFTVQFKRYEEDGCGYFAVALKDTQTVIGQAGILKYELDGKTDFAIGYIFDDHYWNKGYATESAKACIDFAFQQLGAAEIYCEMRPENQPSVKVAERLGMARIGEHVKTYRGKEMPHYIYILKRDSSCLTQ